jgi:hypothetical protein
MSMRSLLIAVVVGGLLAIANRLVFGPCGESMRHAAPSQATTPLAMALLPTR